MGSAATETTSTDAEFVSDACAPGAEAIAALARALLEQLPSPLAERFESLPIDVIDFPEPSRLAQIGLDDPFDLIGQFESDEAASSDADPAKSPTRLIVFRRPLLDYWVETGLGLRETLQTILHEEITRRIDAKQASAA